MRSIDWSSDVCSSDLRLCPITGNPDTRPRAARPARNHRYDTNPANRGAILQYDELQPARYQPGFPATTSWTLFSPEKTLRKNQTKSDLGRKPAKSFAVNINKTYAIV